MAKNKETKVIITGLSDPKGEGDAGTEYPLQINPEGIKHTRAINVNTKAVGDTAGPVGQFQGYGDDTITLDFFIDGSGVIDGSFWGTVPMELKKLENCIYGFDASQHKPRPLLVTYGGFVFRCTLTSYTTDYLLFDRDGLPLRAKVSLGLKGAKEKKKKNSPDMTHAKTIREGDSLPLLCKEIYGKMDYYIQVAEHNGLTNFRELEIGSTVEFPPLQR